MSEPVGEIADEFSMEMGAQPAERCTPVRAVRPRLHVVLFEPEIASNTGAIGRTCVAAGAGSGWFGRWVSTSTTSMFAGPGLDYWEHLDLKVVNHLDEAGRALGRDRLWSFSTKASLLYTDAVFQPGDAFVFGPESRGLPRSWLADRPDRALRIPIRPEARSLNLASSVAIVLYEAVRQIGSHA